MSACSSSTKMQKTPTDARYMKTTKEEEVSNDDGKRGNQSKVHQGQNLGSLLNSSPQHSDGNVYGEAFNVEEPQTEVLDTLRGEITKEEDVSNDENKRGNHSKVHQGEKLGSLLNSSPHHNTADVHEGASMGMDMNNSTSHTQDNSNTRRGMPASSSSTNLQETQTDVPRTLFHLEGIEDQKMKKVVMKKPTVPSSKGDEKKEEEVENVDIASQSGHEDVAHVLLENGADVNNAMDGGATPLHSAPKHSGATPLFIASREGHETIVQMLLKNGADVNKSHNTPLFIACENGHEPIVQMLLEKGADVNKAKDSGATPLFIASQKGHETVVQMLLEKGADVNKAKDSGATPLFIASQKGNENIVKMLLKNGADVNKAKNNGVTPLFIASQEGHESIVKMLLKNGADVNKAKDNGSILGATPLFIASQKGHESIVQMLLENGADVNKANDNGATLLFIASQKGHETVVQILLENGADVNKAKYNGVTPLFIASQKGHENIVRLLLENGADVNKAKDYGATPLFIASEKGHETVVQILLENGADVNKADCGTTFEAVARLRLRNGADVIKCYPLYIASENGHDTIVKLLFMNGADLNNEHLERYSLTLPVFRSTILCGLLRNTTSGLSKLNKLGKYACPPVKKLIAEYAGLQFGEFWHRLFRIGQDKEDWT